MNRGGGRGRNAELGRSRGRGDWWSLCSDWFADLVNIEILLAKTPKRIKLKGDDERFER